MAQTDSDTIPIFVTAVNDAPTATIVPASYNAAEQVPLALQGTGLSVADADAGLAMINLTLSVDAGTLTVAAGTTGVSIGGSGTGSVLVIGTLTQLNDLLSGNLGGTINYLMNSDTPPASATFTLAINDGGAAAPAASSPAPIRRGSTSRRSTTRRSTRCPDRRRPMRIRPCTSMRGRIRSASAMRMRVPRRCK